MRLIKEDNEIVLMQKAADISINNHFAWFNAGNGSELCL
jgi:Xaa-Pro aminopeptidase